MYKAFILLASVSITCGFQYDGLRVKFGWSDVMKDKEYFFKIPRTISEADSGGWQRTERPKGPMPELRLYCLSGRAVCPLFDTAGFVAGLQLAIPTDEYDGLPFKYEKHFTKWSPPSSVGEPAREYWTITQYFVSEESLKSGAGPTIENGATLQDGAVWVKGPDGHLLRIPTTEAELTTTSFRKQNCIPNMGIHYFYNISKQLKCEDMEPWFPLTTEGQLVGVGFQMYGKVQRRHNQEREWFELSSGGFPVELVMPDAPSCLKEWYSTYSSVFLHIYYRDDPWNIRCRVGKEVSRVDSAYPGPSLANSQTYNLHFALETDPHTGLFCSSGDSVKPGRVLHRAFLAAVRYGTSISDSIRYLFTG